MVCSSLTKSQMLINDWNSWPAQAPTGYSSRREFAPALRKILGAGDGHQAADRGVLPGETGWCMMATACKPAGAQHSLTHSSCFTRRLPAQVVTAVATTAGTGGLTRRTQWIGRLLSGVVLPAGLAVGCSIGILAQCKGI